MAYNCTDMKPGDLDFELYCTEWYNDPFIVIVLMFGVSLAILGSIFAIVFIRKYHIIILDRKMTAKSRGTADWQLGETIFRLPKKALMVILCRPQQQREVVVPARAAWLLYDASAREDWSPIYRPTTERAELLPGKDPLNAASQFNIV